MYRYFKKIGNTEHISSKGLSDETIRPPTTSDNSSAAVLSYIGNRTRVKFDGGFLKQDKITFTHGTIVNIYIVYELSFSDSNDLSYFRKLLFGAVKLVKKSKMQILLNTNILDTVLDLIEKELFHFLLVDLVEM